MPGAAHPVFAFSRFPAELRLLLRAVRWPAGASSAAICEVASAGLDWEYFLRLCGHHRVLPLVYRGLSAAGAPLPEHALAALKTATNDNAMSAFRYLAEARRLADLLEQAGIPVQVLKGVPLSQSAFGDLSVRDVGDIDLLIPPGMEETADNILLAEGFVRSDPGARLTPRRRRSWQRHGKDYTYRADHDNFEIDLHWRLFRNPLMPGNALAGTPGEPMRFGDIHLTVLPLDQSFLYLCVHGALEGWCRFKSLVDVATLWRSFDEGHRTALCDRAHEHGILPELAAALQLAETLQLLGPDALTVPVQLQASGRSAQWILDFARKQHLAHAYQPTQEKAGSWQLKRYELGLRRDFAYRTEILRRILLRPRVWARFDLPDILFPLYPLLSPLEWILFHRSGSVARRPRVPRRIWSRWLGLPASQKWLLMEAFGTLLAARIALGLLPARWIFHWLEKPPRHPSSLRRTNAVERIRWAVLTVARYGPLSFVCFPQALAAHAMLRRRGIGSIMHYGIRRSADRQMRAHTWLEVENRMLLGGESAMLYAPIHSTGGKIEHP